MKIKAIHPYDGPVDDTGLVDVYDLTVKTTHLYFANGVLVSNSKRLSMMETNALLSAGATETLRGARSVRGQRNDDYWLQFMQGHTPVDPQVPFTYQKFVNRLKGAGVNVVPEGGRINIMALGDSDIQTLTGDRLLKNAETVRFDRGMEPMLGGLFDPKLTGGHHSNKWSFYEMAEPMPSPVMADPIRHLLGLTEKKYLDVLAGKEKLPKHGAGPGAIAAALENINIPKEIAAARIQIKGSNRGARDAAVRKLGYLKTAQKHDLHPKDWVWTRMPVLPSVFRPVSVMQGSGTPLVDDMNALYKDFHDANENLRGMKKELGDEHVGEERLAVYNAMKAATGIGDPITKKSQEKNMRGILKNIFGSSPKFSSVQRSLLSSTVDNVGRAVSIPNPDLDMDSVGIPEKIAFDIYSKFIVRRLHRKGMPITEALGQVKEKTPLARKMIMEEMEGRPVLVSRAPTLHKFGIMAFRPQLVIGNAVQTHPLINKGYGLDHDGDQMNMHVPTSSEEVEEAYDRLLPSRNLLSPADFKSPMATPSQAYQYGLHHASTAKHEGKPHIFGSKAEALAAYKRGDLRAGDNVRIME